MSQFSLGIRRNCLLVFACLIPLAAEPLTKGERDQAMSYLHATRKQVLDAVSPLSDEQLAFKPGADRWSVAQVAEHLAETEVFLRGMIQQNAKKLPVDEAKRAARRAGREQSMNAFTAALKDRTQKATAPEPAQPKGRYDTKAAVLAAFKERRDATIRYVETTDDDLRGRFFPMGPGNERDLYEMVMMIAAHTERHLAQMKEVMAAPGFPKKQ